MADRSFDDELQDEGQSQIISPDKIPPDHVGVLVAGVVMMAIGWFGIYQLVTTTLPRVGQRWMFFLLLELAVTPPDRELAAGATATLAPAAEPDGQMLLELAGSDPGTLRSVEPAWFPSVFADQQVAWEAVPTSTNATPTRVEAAFLRGRPVAFRRIEPWTRPRGPDLQPPSAAQWMGEAMIVAWLLASMAGGALLARHNIRLGRGDRRGAFRLAATVVVAESLYWLLRAHHVAGFEEIDRFLSRAGQSLLFGGLVWIFYLALEPYLRRFWPQIIVSWVRLLDGRFRDPLVGRDTLVGLLAGAVFTLITRLMVIGPGWLGLPSVRPGGAGSAFELLGLAGLSGSAGLIGRSISLSLFFPMAIMVILLLARIIFRRTWAAWATIILLNGLSVVDSTGNPYLDIPFGCLNAILHLTLVFRFGLLADVVSGFAEFVLSTYPMTFDAGHWYSGNTLFALLVLAAIAVFSFRASLAGRPALGAVLAPEIRPA